ncbi:MAG: type II CAAX endopeptidase family protein [Dethiobacteria bacterium]|nr:CPBP family intramembrane metalloprotease [Bacillota bacterium]HOA36627.1 type II CAAX endopeptidase family protein [Bacillota bacterium]HOJ85161.1 type II CAAX endopeptidase family protein [Bacillota bacterium]HQE10963.1 type II CAAX endopeptidase family protein [Bacillota bacterium]
MNSKKKPSIFIGLIVFMAVLLLLILVAAPMQLAWGMWGLALTELMILACAVVPALILKWDLREIFKVSRPSARQIFGVLVLWLGAYIAVLAIVMITTYLFPKGMGYASNEMLKFIRSVSFPLALFIMAVMPAVCEEALHRGLILHTFGGKNKWVTIMGMGLIFGIFHLDPYRFLGAGVLGTVLTLIMIETRNLALPVLFHFINNSVSSLSALTSEPGLEPVRVSLSAVGISLVMASAVPFLLVAGSRLLRGRAENRSNPVSKRTKFIAAAATVMLAAAGIGIISAYFAQEPLFETSFSGGVNRDTPPHNLEFAVPEDGSYLIDLSIQGDGVITTMIIVNSRGEEVFNASGMTLTLNGSIELEAGDYLITLTHDTDSADYMNVSVDILIKMLSAD